MSAVCWHFAVSGLCSLGSLCTHAERGVPCVDVTPIFFMWEKLVGTHYKPAYIRLPSRLPVGESLSSPICLCDKRFFHIWDGNCTRDVPVLNL